MSCKKKLYNGLALLVSLSLCAALTACDRNNGDVAAPETSAVAEEPAKGEQDTAARPEAPQTQVDYTPGLYDDWAQGDYVTVSLQGDSISVEGTGAEAGGAVLTISEAGVYVISGTLENGRILVQAGKEDTVQLVLNGVDIACSDSAPIYSAKAGLTVLTLAEGTQNTLLDGMEYAYENSEADEPDAAVFCKDDLVITGPGALSVTGRYNNGIGSKDDLVIEGGDITVTAANHGIRGRDSLLVLDGTLRIEAGNDGLQSNNDTGEGKGGIVLAGGIYNITAAHDGVQAETDLTVLSGTFHILSGGGHQAVPEDLDGSYKGLKAGGDLVIEGGSLLLDCADDAVHANGDVRIEGGSLELASGDDGVHADGNLTINDGAILIAASYEGLEGQSVDIHGGEIRLTARDDGINAAGDDGEESGRFGADRFRANENNYINITGGRIVVTASGDGVDSNGHITMSGGVLLVNGPTSGGDAPLDFDGTFTLTGGVIAAAGSSGMAQAPGSDSTQPSLQIYFTETQEAGTSVHLADAQDNPILTFTPEKPFQNIVLTSPSLALGETCRVYTGGSDAGAGEDGLVLEGSYSGGTLLLEAALEEVTTRLTDTGEAASGGMFGAGGMPGGMGGRPGGTRPEGGQPPREGQIPEGGQPPGDGQRPGGWEGPSDDPQQGPGQEGEG